MQDYPLLACHEHTTLSPDQRDYHAHTHDSHELYCFLAGDARYAVEGTLYPLLTRLKNDDLLQYEWVESTQGPPRKYYRLTPKGEAFLTELDNSWRELSDTVNHLKRQA